MRLNRAQRRDGEQQSGSLPDLLKQCNPPTHILNLYTPYQPCGSWGRDTVALSGIVGTGGGVVADLAPRLMYGVGHRPPKKRQSRQPQTKMLETRN